MYDPYMVKKLIFSAISLIGARSVDYMTIDCVIYYDYNVNMWKVVSNLLTISYNITVISMADCERN